MDTIEVNLDAAASREICAWGALKGRLPGTAQYSDELWACWEDAEALYRAARQIQRSYFRELQHLVAGPILAQQAPSAQPALGLVPVRLTA